MNKTPKFCGKCGTALRGDERYCGECGAAVLHNQKPLEKKQSHNRKKAKKTGTRNGPEAKQKQAGNSNCTKNGLLIPPLLYWAGVWCAALVLTSFPYLLMGEGRYFYYILSMAGWIWLAIGLLSASLLQWLKITTQGPTVKMAGIIILSWTAILIPILLTSLDGIVLLLPTGAIIGTFLAWTITRLTARENGCNISRNSRLKLMGGWALCGILSGFPYWRMYLPFRETIPLLLLVIVCAGIFSLREK